MSACKCTRVNVYMCACMHVCTGACVQSSCVHACVCVKVYMCASVHMCRLAKVHVSIRPCVRIYMCAWPHICMCACVRVCTGACVCIKGTCMHVSVCTCMHVACIHETWVSVHKCMCARTGASTVFCACGHTHHRMPTQLPTTDTLTAGGPRLDLPRC